MKKYICAEWLKYRHGAWKSVFLLTPFLCVALSSVLTHQYFAVDGYNWWYMTLYPATLAILCGIIGAKDKKKKNAAIWSLPCGMGKIWDAKVITGVLFSGVSMLCFTVLLLGMESLMETQFHMTFLYKPPISLLLLASVLIWLTSLWQIPFCIWLSWKLGFFLMLCLHMGTYIMAAALVSLKTWFAVIPQGITARLMCAALGVLPNGLLAVEGQMTYSPELVEGRWLLVGVPAALLWLAVFWLAGRKWFERQVGKQ